MVEPGEVHRFFPDRHAHEHRQRQRPGVVGAHTVDVEPGEGLRETCGRRLHRLAGDVDGHVQRGPQLLDQDARLAARTAAELDQLAVRAEELRHRGGMLAHDGELGARGIVLGQLADLLEQTAAARVVEILRRQCLPRRCQPAQHLAQEGGGLRQKIVEAHYPGVLALLRMCHRSLDSSLLKIRSKSRFCCGPTQAGTGSRGRGGTFPVPPGSPGCVTYALTRPRASAWRVAAAFLFCPAHGSVMRPRVRFQPRLDAVGVADA